MKFLGLTVGIYRRHPLGFRSSLKKHFCKWKMPPTHCRPTANYKEPGPRTLAPLAPGGSPLFSSSGWRSSAEGVLLLTPKVPVSGSFNSPSLECTNQRCCTWFLSKWEAFLKNEVWSMIDRKAQSKGLTGETYTLDIGKVVRATLVAFVLFNNNNNHNHQCHAMNIKTGPCIACRISIK